jgi:hypothetical protein
MVPKPVGDNAQKQPVTIALKNICRDYPAGGGVLRELLQNADDAGATTVVSIFGALKETNANELIPAIPSRRGNSSYIRTDSPGACQISRSGLACLQ